MWLVWEELMTYDSSWKPVDTDLPLKVYDNSWEELDWSDELQIYDTEWKDIWSVDDYMWGDGKVKATFKNWNGRVLKTQKVEPWETPTAPADPTRPSDAQYNYTFTGWNPEVGPIYENTEYIAQYEATPIPPTPSGDVTDVELTSFSEEYPNIIYQHRWIGTGIKVTPYTASNVQVSVVSSDPNVVEVWEIWYDEEPQEWSIWSVSFTGVGVWECSVTITSLDNPAATRTYNFVCEADVPVQSISNISSTNVTAYTGWFQTSILTFDYLPTTAVAPNEDIIFGLKEWETQTWWWWAQWDWNGSGVIMFQADWGSQVWDSAVYELYVAWDEQNKTEVTVTLVEWISSLDNLDTETLTLAPWETDTTRTFDYLPTTADFNQLSVMSTDDSVATATIVKDSDWAGHIEVTGVVDWSCSIELWIWGQARTSMGVSVVSTPVEQISNLSSSSVTVQARTSTTITADYLPVDADNFSNITFVPTVAGIATASVQSANSWTLTIAIKWVAIWTTQFDIQIDGVSTGLTIDVTVQWFTVTFDVDDGSYSEDGGTVSVQSIDVPAWWYTTARRRSGDSSQLEFVYNWTVIATVTATPDASHVFWNWLFDESYDRNSWIDGASIDGNMIMYAQFNTAYTVSFVPDVEWNGTVSPSSIKVASGTSYKTAEPIIWIYSPNTLEFSYVDWNNQEVTIQVQSTPAQWKVSAWFSQVAGTIEEDTTISALFNSWCTVTFVSDPAWTWTISPSEIVVPVGCEFNVGSQPNQLVFITSPECYDYGTVTATPNQWYEFVEWDATSYSPSSGGIISQDETIGAKFALSPTVTFVPQCMVNNTKVWEFWCKFYCNNEEITQLTLHHWATATESSSGDNKVLTISDPVDGTIVVTAVKDQDTAQYDYSYLSFWDYYGSGTIDETYRYLTSSNGLQASWTIWCDVETYIQTYTIYFDAVGTYNTSTISFSNDFAFNKAYGTTYTISGATITFSDGSSATAVPSGGAHFEEWVDDNYNQLPSSWTITWEIGFNAFFNI